MGWPASGALSDHVKLPHWYFAIQQIFKRVSEWHHCSRFHFNSIFFSDYNIFKHFSDLSKFKLSPTWLWVAWHHICFTIRNLLSWHHIRSEIFFWPRTFGPCSTAVFYVSTNQSVLKGSTQKNEFTSNWNNPEGRNQNRVGKKKRGQCNWNKTGLATKK